MSKRPGEIEISSMLLELDGYRYPDAYRWLRLQGFRGFAPWRCIDDIDEATTIRKEFLLEVAGGSISVRDMLPFARAEPEDEFAGFIQRDGLVTDEVCVAHLTFRGSAEIADYPSHTVYPSLWDWLSMVIAQTHKLCEPQTLTDLEASLRA